MKALAVQIKAVATANISTLIPSFAAVKSAMTALHTPVLTTTIALTAVVAVAYEAHKAITMYLDAKNECLKWRIKTTF